MCLELNTLGLSKITLYTYVLVDVYYITHTIMPIPKQFYKYLFIHSIVFFTLQGTPLAIEPTIEAHDPDYTFNETIKLSFDGK